MTIAVHEIAIAHRSRRLWILGGLAGVLVTVAVAQGTHDHLREEAEGRRLARLAEEEWRAQDAKSPHAANHFGKWVTKPRTTLSLFDRGVEDHLGQRVVLDAHARTPLVGSTAEDDPIRARLGGFDLGFVLAVLLPLLVVFGAHDAIAGEKQRGTLKSTLGHPIRRRAYLAGKLLGQVAIFALAFAPPLLLGLAAPLAAGVRYDLADLAGLGAMLGAALLYVAFFVLLSLGVSASTHRPSAALAALLAIWLGITFLVPRLGVLVAEAAHPPAPSYELHHAGDELRKELEAPRREAFERVVAELREAHPEIPADFARARGDHGAKAAPGWKVDPAGVFAAQANAMLDEARARRVARVRASGDRAQDLASAIALLSPMTSLQRGTSAVAGTDLPRHRHFEAQVDGFFLELGGYFNDLWARNVRTITAADVAAAPSFAYAPEPAGRPWARFGRAALALLAFTAGAAIFAAARIARYDAR